MDDYIHHNGARFQVVSQGKPVALEVQAKRDPSLHYVG
jgi:hypothetical protein